MWVSEDGQPEKLFTSGSLGSANATWIRPEGTYDIRLYAGSEHRDLLASVTVGQPDPIGGGEWKLTVEPNPVPVDEQELGVTTITWTTAGKGGGEVYVAEDHGSEQLFARGSRGSGEAQWICPGHIYEFRLYQGVDHVNILDAVTVIRADPEPGHELPSLMRCPPPADNP